MRTVEKKLDIKTRKIPVSKLVYDKQEDSIFKYQIYNTDFLYQRPIYWISSINQDIANWYPFDASNVLIYAKIVSTLSAIGFYGLWS